MDFTKISKKVTQVSQMFQYDTVPPEKIEVEVEKDGIIYKSFGYNTELAQLDPHFKLGYRPTNNPNVYLNGVKLVVADMASGARYGVGFTCNFQINTICIPADGIVPGDIIQVDYLTREKVEYQKTYI